MDRNQNLHIHLIDAQNVWQAGPAYSYSTINRDIAPQKSRFALPGDTLLSKQFFEKLPQIIPKLSKLQDPCIFYAELPIKNRRTYRIVINTYKKRDEGPLLKNPKLQFNVVKTRYGYINNTNKFQPILVPFIFITPNFH